MANPKLPRHYIKARKLRRLTGKGILAMVCLIAFVSIFVFTPILRNDLRYALGYASLGGLVLTFKLFGFWLLCCLREHIARPEEA